MPHPVPGLFDRMEDAASLGQHLGLEASKASITSDLEALLNTRRVWPPERFGAYPLVAASVLNYGLNDFAALCVSSNSDQQTIANAIRQLIARYEPRLRRISVRLHVQPGAINRVDFIISAELRAARGEAMLFNAVFCPAQQRYALEIRR